MAMSQPARHEMMHYTVQSPLVNIAIEVRLMLRHAFAGTAIDGSSFLPRVTMHFREHPRFIPSI
jgi:hypothetical protein